MGSEKQMSYLHLLLHRAVRDGKWPKYLSVPIACVMHRSRQARQVLSLGLMMEMFFFSRQGSGLAASSIDAMVTCAENKEDRVCSNTRVEDI